MEDLKKAQLTLPLKLEEAPNYNDLVKQNWKLTFSRQHLTSVHTKRVMGLIAAQIKKEEEVRDYYQIRAGDIIEVTELSNKPAIYRAMKTTVIELAGVTIYVENGEGTIIPRHLLDTTRFKNPSGYYGGNLVVAFNPQLKEFVKQLGHYAQYELDAYMKFKSWYSMRLWELLSAYRDTGFWLVGIDEYRDLMGCGAMRNSKNEPIVNTRTGKFKYEKYGVDHSRAINRTTLEPLKELAGTECEFTVQPKYNEFNVGRGRAAITAVEFRLKNVKKKGKALLQEWFDKHEGFKELYDRLTKTWKVNDEVIIKHIPVLRTKGFHKLVYEWQEKQTSDDRINNLENYCNSAVKKASEEIQDKIAEGKK